MEKITHFSTLIFKIADYFQNLMQWNFSKDIIKTDIDQLEFFEFIGEESG